MLRLYFLFITTLLFLRCNSALQNKTSNQIQKNTELLLDDTYRVSIATKIDTVSKKINNQKLCFWKGDTQIKEISPNIFNFINRPNPYINQIAEVRLRNGAFYLLYVNLANGEPEYYIVLNPKGELVAYEVCTTENCQTTLIQKDSQSKELIDFFQNDTIQIDFRDLY